MIESRWRAIFSTPELVRGPTQPSIEREPGLSRGLSGRRVAMITHHYHVAPRLKKNYSYTSTAVWKLVACCRVTLPLHCAFHYENKSVNAVE
jgi:hypothetical protein